MKKRYIYLILFAVPGALTSLVAAAMVLGMAAGILWLFVFGDDPWPDWSTGILVSFGLLAFLVCWAGSMILGFNVGKKREADPRLNRAHVAVSVGFTIAVVLFVMVYELGVGNLGPKSAGAQCADLCSARGYYASSQKTSAVGEQLCTCLDAAGKEVITVPMDGK